MTDGPVAFIDSGIGGLPYLSFARGLLPGARFVYAADRENFPYGDKDPEEITRAVISLTERILARERPRIVVVACNTASVVSLGSLRACFTVPFVGVVPAVKPAAALSRSKSVGILATQRTVEGEYLKDLILRHAEGCRVQSFPAGGLVSFVERELYTAAPSRRRERVAAEARFFQDAGVDTVVLACTHFLHLESEFREALGDGVQVVDSRDGVSRQIARLLGPSPGRARAADPDLLYVTGAAAIEERYGYFARIFGLEPGGRL
jgi:glutamate racemase